MLWNIVTALAIVAIGHVLGLWLAGAARMGLTRTGMDPEIRRLAANAVHPLLLVVAIITALPWVGVQPTSLVAVLGAATLAIGLALRTSLSNVASGAILLTLRPFREGDLVEAAGRTGVLEKLELYATTLRTPDSTLITLPNDVVMRAPIVNFTRLGRRRAEVEWLVAPDGAKVQTALDALSAVVQAHDRVLSDPAPTVLVVRQQPGAVAIVARAFVEAADFGDVRRDLLTQGLQALAKKKVPLAAFQPGS